MSEKTEDEAEFRCQNCTYHMDKSYNFDEQDSDTGWKCNNPGSEFYNLYFYPTDRDYWLEWHEKLKQCKGHISKLEDKL